MRLWRRQRKWTESPDNPVLLQLSSHPADGFRLADAFEGVVCFGSSGSGKTTGSGAAIARAYLAAGFGGLVLPNNIARVSCTSSGRPAASNMSAIVPHTWGAAILVPLFDVYPAPARSFGDAERAARTWTPGATSSGFTRPSRVGPALENRPSARSSSWAS